MYPCLDRVSGQPVALKTFQAHYLSSRALRARFLQEGSAWMRLGVHPHVVQCDGVERLGDGTEIYLVLELVAKGPRRRDGSLRSWLAPGKPLALDLALLIALQVARGMHHASSTIPGFVHRDLKPENVLLGADGWSAAGFRVCA